MTLKSGQQIITIHILFNISSSQCNQAMKIGQLIEYNTRNIFIEKLYTKYGGEASPRPFHKNQNWTYLWTNSLKCYKVCFYCMFKSKIYQNIFKRKCQTLAFILYKASFFLKKKKKIWNSSSCLAFCMTLEEKYFSNYILLTDEISLPGSLYFLRFVAQPVTS